MSCPSELTWSLYVDGALGAERARQLGEHSKDCSVCRSLIESLGEERNLLRSAMQSAGADGVIPAFAPRPTISRLLVWLGWAAIAVWGISTIWLSLMDTLTLPTWLGWLSPSALGTGIQLLLSTVLPGGGSVDLTTGLIATVRSVAIALTAIVGFGWLVRNQPRNASASVLALSVAGVMLTAAPGSHAFEMRRDEQRVVVGPDEVIDDTLIITSEDILIEGTVTGDLIAISESLRILGRVDGLVIAIGESVQLEGTFGQSVLGIGEKVEVRDATLSANFYGAGERVLIQKGVAISGNLAAAGEEAEMHGSIAGDLISAGERVTLFGSVGGNMRAYGATVELTDSARVNGDLTLMTEGAETALVAPGAVVSGATNASSWPEEPNRYTTPEFYLGELLQIFAAFVTGLVLFRFLPALADAELKGGTEALFTAGLGAAVLIGTPLLAVAAVITLIGAPLGLMLFVAWLITLYAAGIVIAGYIGRLILPDQGANRALPLLLGLTLLVVLSEVPILGGPVQLVAGILGLGLIAEWLRSLRLARSA